MSFTENKNSLIFAAELKEIQTKGRIEESRILIVEPVGENLFLQLFSKEFKVNLYLAPMEGITGYLFRNIFHEYFGAGVDKYYTPFFDALSQESDK